MRQISVLLAVLLILGVGILAAGCTMPEGDGIQPTPTEPMTTPMETGTPMEIETPMETGTPMEIETPMETGTPMEIETPIGAATTVAGG
ncbi:MAG: hypothetical protein M0P21_08255 [Methanoculleus sp.]|jgi:hypothetical protein|nr:hypothetical protein [Methanoculleus sp.]PKL56603.1 MAG: hypothetical protein CVV35_04105 [Methanomicrobiales archaeon HGW-Methanomicrobiales-6]